MSANNITNDSTQLQQQQQQQQFNCDRILNLTQTIKPNTLNLTTTTTTNTTTIASTIKPTNDDTFDITLQQLDKRSTTFMQQQQQKQQKSNILNSTMNNEHLLDLTINNSPNIKFMSVTQDISYDNNQTHLLYMTSNEENIDHQNVDSHFHTSTDDEILDETLINNCIKNNIYNEDNCEDENIDDHHHIDDDDLMMDIDDQTKPIDMDFSFDIESGGEDYDVSLRKQQQHITTQQNQQNGANNIENKINLNKPRFSFGLDLTDCTLDCSIELYDDSMTSSSALQQPLQVPQQTHQLSKSPCSNLTKQNSFEIDESLGILTPDQMKEFLDSTTTTTNLDLPLGQIHSNNPENKLSVHQYRIDQTPSPEELPLDPVSVKTDITDMIMMTTHDCCLPPSASVLYQELSQTDSSDSKTDHMTKSGTSKQSNSFITSVTSITSLDTGYQGDGEMSRPASRGADHSPSNMMVSNILTNQKIQNNNNSINWNMNAHPPIPRRGQDPMTDSDFFTESDADDIFHRGDRRAQVIDGQLYGPTLQAANVYINQQVNADDSCMESSGIFTDVENRGDDDLIHRPGGGDNDNDLSPDASTDTIRSTASDCSQKKFSESNSMVTPTPQQQKEQHDQNFTPIDMSPTTATTSNDTKNDENLINDVDVVKVEIVDDTSFVSISKSNITDLTPDSSCSKITSSKTFSSSLTLNGIGKKQNTIRKQNKNEANANLKKHEMSKRIGGNIVGSSGNGKTNNSLLIRGVGNSRKNSSDENQENKRPIGSSITTTNNNSARKHQTILPNKWNAVMNKIAENKTITKNKLNFSEIKSKVSTGVVIIKSSTSSTQRSPVLMKTPPSNDHQINTSTTTTIIQPPTGAKRTILSSTKRGRTFSKDSQQSSQSDLSLNGGSPKLQIKNGQTTRSAKKRDVRTISNSPSDLGPPSKTVGTPRSNRAITLQKRSSPTAITTPTQIITPIAEIKNSPPAKKIVPRRPIIQQQQQTQQQQQQHVVVKLPLKDHNRLAGPTPIPKGTNNTTTTKTLLRSSPSHNTTTNNVVTQQQQQQQKNGSTQQLVTLNDGTSQQKTIVKTTNLNNNNNHSHNNNNNINSSSNNNINLINNNNKIAIVELNLAHANKGIEALSVLIQHLVFNLDAFSCPPLKVQNEIQSKNLVETRLLLDDTRATCQNLEDQLVDKETLFAARESELQELHRRELNKAENCLTELERTTHEHIVALESEITKKSIEAEEKLKNSIQNSEIKIIKYENNLKEAKAREIDLLKRISALSCTENELREKVLASENEFGERIRLATQRERELTDKYNILNRQLDDMKLKAEQKERELGEKLNISQGEICVLRRHSTNRSSSTEHQQSVQQQQQHLSKSPTSLNRIQILQDEVESLRCVLELKQSEITDLRKQTQEYERAAEELPAALIKISGLESRVEDLQVQLNAKLEQEKDLSSKNKHLQESYAHELNNRNRLSLHNEELRWKLKQNSEKFALALNDLSKSYIDQSTISLKSNSDIESYNSMTKSNGSDKILECFEMDDVSPPTSPVIKGVVEKSDSVSWVLEMDDETPEALASRMVRRAGSFRSNLGDKYIHSPIPKRQKCQGNILSQSASAASILRQNSDTSPQKQTQVNQRIRSKSVSVKDTEPKRIVRSNSSTSASRKMDMVSSWKDPLCASSPYSKQICPIVQENGKDLFIETNLQTKRRIETPTTYDDFERNNKAFRSLKREQQQQQISRGLITCNTAALITNRPELCPTLPSHPSVQDLKKHQRPKVSAGEAMVSGTNSEEDETSSTSSDSSSESLNHSSSSNSARHQLVNDVLMQKYVASLEGGGGNGSGNGGCMGDGGSTPMDVSWSEDNDHFTSESVV